MRAAVAASSKQGSGLLLSSVVFVKDVPGNGTVEVTISAYYVTDLLFGNVMKSDASVRACQGRCAVVGQRSRNP